MDLSFLQIEIPPYISSVKISAKKNPDKFSPRIFPNFLIDYTSRLLPSKVSFPDIVQVQIPTLSQVGTDMGLWAGL